MIFKRLEIKNFLSYRNATLDLQNPGLTLVTGRNLDAPYAESNGSGKSSLLSALVWALFGKAFHELTGDEVINNQVGKDCSVTLDFSENGLNGKIVRFRKLAGATGLRLFINGKEATRASVAETQKLIDSLLGVDFKTFSNVIAFPQGNARLFASLTDREQKEILEKMLNLEVLTEYLQRTKELKSQIEDEKAEKASELEKQELLLERSTSQLVMLKEKEKEFDEQKKLSLQRLKDDLTEIEERLRVSQQQLKDFKDLTPDIEALQEKLNAFDEETLLSSRQEFLSSHAEYSQLVKTTKEQIEQLQLRIQRIHSLKGMERCPYCGQRLTKEGLVKFAKELQLMIDEEEKKLNMATRQVGLFSNEIVRVDKKLEKIQQMKQELEQLKSQAHIQEVKKAALEGEIRRLKEQLTSKQKEIESKRKENSPYKSLIAKEEANQIKLKSSISALIKVIEKQNEELEYLKFWEVGFGNQGLKSFILDSIIDFLNKEANYYSQKLSDGDIQINFHTQERLKSGKVRERFGVDVKLRNGAHLYNGTSGGERRRVNLAILLALRKLVASRTSKQFNLLICDEIFDALDTSGIDRAMEILMEEARKGAKVFLVTHSPRFIETDVFDEILVVEKKDGISTVHQRR